MSTGTDFRLSTSILFTLDSKLFRLVGAVFNLSVFNLAESDV